MDHFDEERMATPAQAMREYAMNVGYENPERPWILTDYDVWIKNPHYRGPAVPHPEDDYQMTEEEAKAFAEKIEPKFCPPPLRDDEIPF